MTEQIPTPEFAAELDQQIHAAWSWAWVNRKRLDRWHARDVLRGMLVVQIERAAELLAKRDQKIAELTAEVRRLERENKKRKPAPACPRGRAKR